MTILSEESALVFEEVTDGEIIEYTHLQNGEVWRGGLSVEQYKVRESILGKSEIAQKGRNQLIKAKFPDCSQWLGIKYFVMKDLRLPSNSKTSQIVSSCEILSRIGYCISSGSEGKIEDCLVATIGGVHTIAAHRKKGYAEKMIQALNKYLDEVRDEPNAPKVIKNMIITLYSEVGEYYAKLGYKSEHVPLHIITKLDEFEDLYCYPELDGKELGFDGYQDLVALEDEAFKKHLSALHKKNPRKFIFTVAADIDLYKWFGHRDIYIMEKTKKGNKKDLRFGFSLYNNSHILWHHHWTEDYLIILKIFIDDSCSKDETVLPKLMSAAVKEAKGVGLTKLQFWDQEIQIKKFPKLEKIICDMESESNVYAKNGSLSAFRPPKGYCDDQVVWDNNTKFCWF